MIKKNCSLLFLLLFLFLSLSGCTTSANFPNANTVSKKVTEEKDLLLQCIREMEAFGCDRIYVALEAMEKETAETSEQDQPKPDRDKILVSYEKESDKRTEIDSPVLREAIETFDLALILFQTDSDARRSVLFSFHKENENGGIQNGFYYSYDHLPCGWWGRKAELKKKDNRYLQVSQNADAWYYTLQISDGFYYFEKFGDLVA